MADEITLTPGATAERDTCGSCKYFERRKNSEYDGMYGKCRIELPKKLATQWDIRRIDPKLKDAEYTGNEDLITDTDRCDLYRPDGMVYIVQRRIGP